jgi:hypothetical protein
MKTKDQLIQDIMNLEIEASKLVAQAGGNICNIYGSNLFNQYLKLTRKIQKLRNKL